MAPQGFFSFGGIRFQTPGCSYTASHGVSPSIAVVTAAEQSGPFPKTGTLAMTYGSTNIVMPGCLLADITYSHGGGPRTMTFHIFDRRWRWLTRTGGHYGYITGEYNIREGGGTIRKSSLKTVHELLALCFRALGERTFNVSMVPQQVPPYVNWDGSPAEALSQLCDALGCRPMLNPLTNKAEVWPIGVGQRLPTGFSVTSQSVSLDPADVPDSFVYLSGKALWQVPLELEATSPDVAEKNSTIKPLSKLSFAPKNLRTMYPPHFSGIEKGEKRDLARKYWYRQWRVKAPQNLALPKHKLQSLGEILPLETHLLDPALVDSKTGAANDGELKERPPAILYGDFMAGTETGKAKEGTVETEHGKKAIYPGNFTIDAERGLVQASEPIFQIVDEGGNPRGDKSDPYKLYIGEAKLWLLTAIGIRDYLTQSKDKTGVFTRWAVPFSPSGSKLGSLPYYIARDDVALNVFRRFTGKQGKIVTNIKEVKAAGEFYIAQALRSFQSLDPGDVSLEGFHRIGLDGAIQQITWSMTTKGAFTSISRNSELATTALTYTQNRRNEQLRASLFEGAREKTRRA